MNYYEKIVAIRTNTDNNTSKGTSCAIVVKFKYILPLSFLLPLIKVANQLKPLELINIRDFEDEYIDNNFKKLDQINDSNINLRKYHNRKLREKFRNVLKQGIPTHSSQ